MKRNIRVRSAWKRITPRVTFPVTVTRPNGETFVVSPTHQKVAVRKARAKKSKLTKSEQPRIKHTITPQDERAIALALREEAFRKSQAKLEREMLGSYN